jgi:LysM repeat protein
LSDWNGNNIGQRLRVRYVENRKNPLTFGRFKPNDLTMKQALLLIPVILLAGGCKLFQDTRADEVRPVEYNSRAAQQEYVLKYKDAAIAEMNRSGIPASIKLAQALLESASGESELSMKANNHFGIKCTSQWTGPTYKSKDDDKDADGNLIESCFRRYNTVAESYADHSEFIRDPRKYHRYGFLFNLDRTDYKSWARGLQSAGYASSQQYADRLIELIERFQLYQYDRPGNNVAGVDPVNPTGPNTLPSNTGKPSTADPSAGPGTNVPNVPPRQRIGRVNDVKVVLAQSGESLEDIARVYQLKTEKVLGYNDFGHAPGVGLPENTRVYIQEKKTKWRGRATHHYVREDQSMFQIAQTYGVRLDKLLERNGLQRGQEPALGERIRLKGKRKSGETVQLRDNANDPRPNTTPALPTVTPPTMEVSGDELFEMGTDDRESPAVTNPLPSTQPGAVSPARPSTTGTPYPDDPAPANPANPGWTPANPSTLPPGGQDPGYVQPRPGYHVVARGDTLYSLSRRYAVPVPELRRLNNLSDDNIKIGQQLRIQ